MVAAQTLPNLPELTPEQAEKWIAAALAEAQALRLHDEQLTPDQPDGEKAAEQIRAAWQRWIDAAEALLSQVRPSLQAKRHIAGAYDLDYAVGRAQAMLTLSPDALRARREQLKRGDSRSIQEARSELRASDRR